MEILGFCMKNMFVKSIYFLKFSLQTASRFGVVFILRWVGLLLENLVLLVLLLILLVFLLHFHLAVVEVSLWSTFINISLTSDAPSQILIVVILFVGGLAIEEDHEDNEFEAYLQDANKYDEHV